ncbi:hypothetical protein BpHYR1_037092 [Brachionus plicatilis]|uniref:Uncharacterized protein n=1 Tax=Brachionus plicatilis TaxID=10195 RepID=A0A3M7SBK1_BRAPC|nr:hypothetical protein BpHYR1_037092 [Brachionus plicatilis]
MCNEGTRSYDSLIATLEQCLQLTSLVDPILSLNKRQCPDHVLYEYNWLTIHCYLILMNIETNLMFVYFESLHIRIEESYMEKFLVDFSEKASK